MSAFKPDSQPTAFRRKSTGGTASVGGNNNNGRVKRECHTFEPQQWRKQVCKNCFRTQPEHNKPSSTPKSPTPAPFAGDGDSSTTLLLRRRSSATDQLAEDDLHELDRRPGVKEGAGQLTTTTRQSTANDEGSRSANNKSTDSSNTAARLAARKGAAAAKRQVDEHRSTSSIESRRGKTSESGNGTSSTHSSSSTNAAAPATSIDPRYIEELENDFFTLEDKHETVLRERDSLAADIEAKAKTIADVHGMLDQYRDKVMSLERKCSHLDEEIKGYRERLRLPESDQSTQTRDRSTSDMSTTVSASGSLSDLATSADLQQRLTEVEQLCQEVMDENDQLKEEIEEMQREIEEMHDHFQEDDRDVMRELQRDLEAANKTCRILQFKLRKAERRFEQCDAERANLEDRLARLESELYSQGELTNIRNLEEELRVAKEVGVRLNNELDLLDEKRAFYVEENRQLKEELENSQRARIVAENEADKLKLNMEKLKSDKNYNEKGPLQVTDKNMTRQSGGSLTSSTPASDESKQLRRELDLVQEREADLIEQFRFSEEEVRKLKRRLKEYQAENELLNKKMDRLFISHSQLPPSTPHLQVNKQHQHHQHPPPPPPNFETASGVGVNRTTDASRGGQPAGTPTSSDDLADLALTKRQMTLAEEDNVGLRRKLACQEREISMAQAELKRLQGSMPRQVNGDAREVESLRCQVEALRDTLARAEDEREGLEAENRRLRAIEQSGKQSDQNGQLAKSGQDEECRRLANNNEQLRVKLKEFNRQFSCVVRNISLLDTTGTNKEQEWMNRYNDAQETITDQDNELTRANKRIADLQSDLAVLKGRETVADWLNDAQLRQQKASYASMEREEVIDELKKMGQLRVQLEADRATAKDHLSISQHRVNSLEDSLSTIRLDKEQRVREMTAYICHIEDRNAILLSVLKLMETHQDMPNSKDGTNNTAEAFEDPSESTKYTINTEFRGQLDYLEQLVKAQSRRAELLEGQLSSSNRPKLLLESSKPIEAKQIDVLKRELEEKDDVLEQRDEQIRDLRERLEQSRKMNDAMRVLVEREPADEVRQQPHKTETNVELVSYRKELECMRKEMQILRTNIQNAEKSREKMSRENRELQEELKLREDSIFDQDDEIEKRNAELRSMKVLVEGLQRELDQAKRELTSIKSNESSRSSGRLSLQIAENERIKAEHKETLRQLNAIKLDFENAKHAASSAEERVSQFNNDAMIARNQLKEKDGLIMDLNRQSESLSGEVGMLNVKLKSVEEETKKIENELEEAKSSITSKDKEIVLLKLRIQELNMTLSPTQQPNRDASRERSRGLESGDSAIQRSADVDRLRRELSMLRSERDDLQGEVKRLRARMAQQRKAGELGSKQDDPFVASSEQNAYVKAMSASQPTKKIQLLLDHITSLNRANVELKIQNESLQNTVLDYQRRYRRVKEQYEGEQESWLTERVVLESKAKEQDEKQSALVDCRKALQEAINKAFNNEVEFEKRSQELQSAYEELDKQKTELEKKMAHYEEQQKLPKVLQRFGASASGNRTSVLAAQAKASSVESKEVARRLDSAERTVNRLRLELVELKESRASEIALALNEAESNRVALEQSVDDLRDRLLTMECYRQQVEMFRYRQMELEESVDRETKRWNDEREQLVLCIEEARLQIDQWASQLQGQTGKEASDTIGSIIKQMESWPVIGPRTTQIQRRLFDSMYSVDLSSSGPGNNSVPASPITTSFIRQGVSQLRALTQRSTSMDWVGAGNRTGHDGLPPVGPIREGSLGPIHAGGGNRGSALSLAFGPNMGSNASLHQASNRRLGRSVSPECTMKKLNNYPDAPPGFFIHTSSRQGSTDSLSSLDYSQRSFTLPGKPHFRSAVSPARKKFFEDSSYSSANYTLKLNPRNGSKHHPQSPPSIDNLSGSSGKATQQATPSINQESGDQSKSARSTAEDGSKRSSGKSERERRSDRSTPSRFFARFTSHSGKSSRKTSPKPGGGGDDSAKSKEQDMGKKLVDALGKRLSSSSNKKADDAKFRGKSGTRQSPASNLASSKSKSIDLASGSGTNKEGEPKHLTGVSKTNEAKRSIEPPSSSSMFGSKMKRSGSVNNISPAIMALRQKFSGGVGSSK